jgi:hypothetical protein
MALAVSGWSPVTITTSWGWIKTFKTYPSKHQNSWDLWMFIP